MVWGFMSDPLDYNSQIVQKGAPHAILLPSHFAAQSLDGDTFLKSTEVTPVLRNREFAWSWRG